MEVSTLQFPHFHGSDGSFHFFHFWVFGSSGSFHGSRGRFNGHRGSSGSFHESLHETFREKFHWKLPRIPCKLPLLPHKQLPWEPQSSSGLASMEVVEAATTSMEAASMPLPLWKLLPWKLPRVPWKCNASMYLPQSFHGSNGKTHETIFPRGTRIIYRTSMEAFTEVLEASMQATSK